MKSFIYTRLLTGRILIKVGILADLVFFIGPKKKDTSFREIGSIIFIKF